MIDYKDSARIIDGWAGNSAAFNNSDTLKQVIFDDGITHIGSEAFLGCSQLETAELPDLLESIGYSAFKDTVMLDISSLPVVLKEIGEGAFSGSGLISVTIPGNLKTLGANAFRSCKNLENVTISDKFTPAEDKDYSSNGPFQDCTALKELTLPCDLNTSKWFGAPVETLHLTAGRTGIMVEKDTAYSA